MTDGSPDLFSPSEDPLAESQRLRAWMADVSTADWLWYVKVLSANDTTLNKSHQFGPYMPKRLVRLVFRGIARRHEKEKNPDAHLHFSLDSHDYARDIRLVWYNNKIIEPSGTRDEARLTQWGGKESPLLDPEATGSLCVFAFRLTNGEDAQECRAWLCEGSSEATALESVVGPVDPGEGLLYSANGLVAEEVVERDVPCRLTEEMLPPAWKVAFPPAETIVALAVQNMKSLKSKPIVSDERLLRRRECEFQIFRSLEDYHVLPRLREEFATVDIFVGFANAITNRRKSRSGASLELHAGHIFREEGLGYARGKTTEGKKRPDFLFPSAEAYHDAAFPEGKLRMLAAKTTCKDRWRQVINEADRIRVKHLLTLQDGVSPNQWKEMDAHGVRLVVPKQKHKSFPNEVRPHLLTLERFIAETKALS